MKAELRQVIINTTNLDGLVAFWAGLLSVGVKNETDSYTWLDEDRENGVIIGFHEVDEELEGPSRILINILVEDLEEATERASRLGAMVVSEESDNVIMTDPDGNEFCLYVE